MSWQWLFVFDGKLFCKRSKMKQVAWHQTYKLLHSNIINTMRKQLVNGRKIFANYISDKIDIKKLILKFTWRCKRSKIGNIILKEKSEVGRLPQLNFKTYYKATIAKKTWCLINNLKARSMEQERECIIGCKYSNWYLSMEYKAIQWSKNNPFNKCYWNNCKRKRKMNIDTNVTPFTKFNSK